MVSADYILWLKEDDLCVILSENGKFGGIWALDHLDCLLQGDHIQEWMSFIMKEEEHATGNWLWHISRDGSKVEGMQLSDD